MDRLCCRPFLGLLLLMTACAAHCGKSTESQSQPSNSEASCIDGHLAIGYIEEIIAFGPRHPGTHGAEKTRKYIIDKLTSFDLKPSRQDFEALTPHPQLKQVNMANIVVDIAPVASGETKKTVLIGGHFDGKILDDMEFFGANDGGSSTALLLEFARCLKLKPPPVPVRIVFFDGEEALVDWSKSDSRYGSKKYAFELRSSKEVQNISAAVIVDMIGDKRLRLFRERLSTSWVMEILENTAKELGHTELFGPKSAVEDDHVSLMHVGIPAAVMIDLNFGPGWTSNDYWHTNKDTIDKLSPKSIETVGQVVISALPALSAGPQKEQ